MGPQLTYCFGEDLKIFRSIFLEPEMKFQNICKSVASRLLRVDVYFEACFFHLNWNPYNEITKKSSQSVKHDIFIIVSKAPDY